MASALLEEINKTKSLAWVVVTDGKDELVDAEVFVVPVSTSIGVAEVRHPPKVKI